MFDDGNWTVYNTSNSGLPSNSVFSIAIDENSNKWIGTYLGGMAKYDGSNWTVYDTSNSDLPDNHVSCIAIDDNDKKWIGTSGGMVTFDDNNWTIYDESNSGFLDNGVSCIAIDTNGIIWAGQGEYWESFDGALNFVGVGLVKWDGYNLTVYDTSNSTLPDNNVHCITIDNSNNKWIGMWDGGLAKFDDNNWTIYDESNSGLLSNCVTSIAIDNSDNKWIGTWDGGLAKFDDNNWTIYDESNSGLPSEYINSIVIDDSDNKWIGTTGIARFDDNGWMVYNTFNSGLSGNWVLCIAIDNNYNKWIGTKWGGGMAVYNGGGIVSIDEKKTTREPIHKDYRLSQNYPNPFNPSTTIEFSLPKSEFVELKIFNILGKEVSTLVSKKLNQGGHIYQFDGKDLASGIYYYQLVAGEYREVMKMIILK
jgi:ligand-binding sensor domain-containing protein